MTYKGATYFFCGVGGSGMSALAKVLLAKGAVVYGSDRNNDHGRFPDHFQKLKDHGVILCPQDGTCVTQAVDHLVVSSAVEPSIPDVKAAQNLNIPIIKRAELLAEICNAARSICVAGTNGKSTITGMIGHVLAQAGCDPTIINGGGMLNFNRENAVIGGSDIIVAETDESDGTVTLFKPHIAVLSNISEDHKGMDELLDIFRQFLAQSDIQVLNKECPHVRAIAADFPDAIFYSAKDHIDLSVPGHHNQSNAAAAVTVAQAMGTLQFKLSPRDSLKSFRGITSRLEVVGRANGVTVIDDFAHNPDKITASLRTLKETSGRLILMYQPHGFKPTRDHKHALIDIFSRLLSADDMFYMPEILYFGGTVEQDISSKDIIDAVSERGIQAHFYDTKEAIEKEILAQAREGDTICIMGARDDSLRQMARNIYNLLL